jgi:hypothetical protein
LVVELLLEILLLNIAKFANSADEIVPFDVVEEFEFPDVGEIDSLSFSGVVVSGF